MSRNRASLLPYHGNQRNDWELDEFISAETSGQLPEGSITHRAVVSPTAVEKSQSPLWFSGFPGPNDGDRSG